MAAEDGELSFVELVGVVQVPRQIQTWALHRAQLTGQLVCVLAVRRNRTLPDVQRGTVDSTARADRDADVTSLDQ